MEEILEQKSMQNDVKTGQSSQAVPHAADRSHFLRLMSSMFKIGAVGFGGGSALIPVIEREVVKDQQLVSEEDYNKDVVVACITPGALPVEIATGIGKRAYGRKGMFLAAALMAFPGALLTVLILSALSGSSGAVLTQIQYLSVGLGAFISCLLIAYAVSSMKEAAKESRRRLTLSAVIMAAVFVLTCGSNIRHIFGLSDSVLFGLSTIQVLGMAFFGILYTNCRFTRVNTSVSAILIALYIASEGKAGWISSGAIHTAVVLAMSALSVYGLIKNIREDNIVAEGAGIRSAKKPSFVTLLKEIGVWTLVIVIAAIPAVLLSGDTILYLIRGFISSILSFGGGDAYLSVVDGMFLSNGTITSAEFYSRLVPVANVLPGSILCKILTGIGYYVGFDLAHSAVQGYLVAIAGFAVSVAASGMIFCIIYWVYEAFENVTVFRKISRWIRPIISGLLLNVMLSMISQNMETGAMVGETSSFALIITVIILAIDAWLLFKKKTGNITLIAFSAIAGMIPFWIAAAL